MISEKKLSNRVLSIRLALGIQKDGSECVIIGKDKAIREAIVTNRCNHRLQYGLYPRGTLLLAACDLHEADELHGINALMLSALNNLGGVSHSDMKNMLDSRYMNFQNPLYMFFLQLYLYGKKTGYSAFQDNRLFSHIGNICDFGETMPLGCESLLANWDFVHHTDYKEIIGFNGTKYVVSDDNGVGNIIQFAVDKAKEANCKVIKDLSMNKYLFNDSNRKEMV